MAKEKILIVGCGDLAFEALGCIAKKYEVVGFVDPNIGERLAGMFDIFQRKTFGTPGKFFNSLSLALEANIDVSKALVAVFLLFFVR